MTPKIDVNKVQVVSFSAPAWMVREMSKEASEQGISISQYIRDLYAEHKEALREIDDFITAMTKEAENGKES